MFVIAILARFWKWLINDADEVAADVEKATDNAHLLLDKLHKGLAKVGAKLVVLILAGSAVVPIAINTIDAIKKDVLFGGSPIDVLEDTPSERLYKIETKQQKSPPIVEED
jgi:hypothetical protein